MTDNPPPPSSADLQPDPPPPAPPPRRWDWRPKLRWFAAEYLIVVLGVLTAVGLNAWWQGRQDAAREREYLVQLVEDLKQTEQSFEARQPEWSRRDSAATLLVRSFRSARTPAVDSVLVWAYRATLHTRPAVVTGTAEALVQTGDLNLIRHDSLRSAITGYLGVMNQRATFLQANVQDAKPHINTLRERVDDVDAFPARSPATGDSLLRAWPMYPIPETPRRAFEVLDVEALLRDREAYTAIRSIWQTRAAMENNRGHILRETVALREQVEAALDR